MTQTQLTSRRFPLIGLALGGLFLCLCLLAGLAGSYFYMRPREAVTEAPAVEYVLDLSSRMDLPAEGGEASRLMVARNVMVEILRPSGETVAGLRVFGSDVATPSCEHTDLIVPLAPANQQRITNELGSLAVGGAADAPLAQAMIAAIRDLADVQGPKSLVVVTGGQDSCQLEAGRLVTQEAQRAGIELRTFVIGFQVTPAEAQAIKEMIATDNQSLYLDAPDETALRHLLQIVQAYVENPNQETLAVIEAESVVAALARLNLTQNPGVSYGPQLVWDRDNRLHFVWWDNSLRATGDVLYRQRTPDGAWSLAESLTSDFEAHIAQYDVQLRLRPDGAVCVFWTALQELQHYQRCRTNDIWETAQPTIPATGIRRDFQPAFAPDGRLHIIYRDGAGDIYSGDQELSDALAAAASPRLVVDGNGRLHAVWLRYEDPAAIAYRWSDDSGATWSEAELVSGTADAAVGVSIAFKADTAGNVHLAWSAGETLYYRRWQPGAGWQPLAVVTNDNGMPRCDNIGLDIDQEGLVHLAWHTGSELFYVRQQTDQTWALLHSLSREGCNVSRAPVLAIGRDGQVHLVWSPNDNDLDLYYIPVRDQEIYP